MYRCFQSLVLGVLAGVLMLPTNAWATSVTAQQCELVELRPGYPGYQGFITGVLGIGDHACLEDLEEQNPGFSKDREDQENADAARSIGLRGEPEVWTWENWLEIEAERGLTPPCYTCASGARGRVDPVGTGIGYDDPRIIVGTYSDDIHRAWEREQGLSTWAGRRMPNFELMVIARTFSGPLNAEEVIEIAIGFLPDLYRVIDGSAQRVNTRDAWDRMVERGGYFDVPESAAIDDQIAIMFMSVQGLEPHMGIQNADLLRYRLTSAMDDWLLELSTGAYQGSFAGYLQDIHAEDWY